MGAPPRRVVLVSDSPGLAAVLGRMLDRNDRLTRVGAPDDLADQAGPVDLVVLDVPAGGRAATCQRVRRGFKGPLIMLVDADDRGRDLPKDAARKLLVRPFAVTDLDAALRALIGERGEPVAAAAAAKAPAKEAPAATAPAPVTPIGVAARHPESAGAAWFATAAEEATLAAGTGAQRGRGTTAASGAAAAAKLHARTLPPAAQQPQQRRRFWERLPLLLGRAVHLLRTRRWVRLAALAALVLVAFLGAFALATQGRHDLTGPGTPALSTAPLPVLGSSVGQLPTTSKGGPTTAPPTTSSGGFAGVTSPLAKTTTSTTRPSTTTRVTATTRAATTTTRVVTTTTIPPTTTTVPTP